MPCERRRWAHSGQLVVAKSWMSAFKTGIVESCRWLGFILLIDPTPSQSFRFGQRVPIAPTSSARLLTATVSCLFNRPIQPAVRVVP